ncbi:MAG: translesion error-prone DNA polymerase V autoproteolytic subunit [Bacteroidales bacterium]|nr:translesion error-prone DNA polymerase V autoproteolytic subunit [Bacteroidales bacterium]
MPRLHIFSACLDTIAAIPYADGGIKAGFPSPAQDYLTESIDLNNVLIRQQETTFYARVDGDSMSGAGIFDGDLVIIDKALEPQSGDLVAAYLDGEFTLKKFVMDDSGQFGWLVPANPRFHAIRLSADDDFRVWGVVTGVIRKLR